MNSNRLAPDKAILRQAALGEPVALLRAMVQTPSVNPMLDSEGEGEGAIARLAAGWLELWGFRVVMEEVAPGRFNVIGRLGDPPYPVMLNGHLDTVGVRSMTVAPFGAEESDGRVYGRGSADMKGGVAAILAAAARIGGAGSAGLAGRGLLVALTADEEAESIGMEALISAGVAAEAKMAVVAEPTSLAVMPAHKGFLWLTLHAEGRAAHGSRPDQGVDAIRAAALYLNALDRYADRLKSRRPHPLLGHASFHAGTIEGGEGPSVYPASCRLVLERRTLPGEEPDGVSEEFREVLRDLQERGECPGARIETGLFRSGSEVPSEGEEVATILRAIEEEGVPGRVEGMTAWVEAGYLNAAGLPAVCLGPGSIAAAHTDDESVPIEEVLRAADIFERLVRG